MYKDLIPGDEIDVSVSVPAYLTLVSTSCSVR